MLFNSRRALLLLLLSALVPYFHAEAQPLKPAIPALFPKGGSLNSRILNLEKFYSIDSSFGVGVPCRLPTFNMLCPATSVVAAMKMRDFLYGQIYEPILDFQRQLGEAESALKKSIEKDKDEQKPESLSTRGWKRIVELLKKKIQEESDKLAKKAQCPKDRLAMIRNYINYCMGRPNYASHSCEQLRPSENSAGVDDDLYDQCVSTCVDQFCSEDNKDIGMCEGDGEDALLTCSKSCLEPEECVVAHQLWSQSQDDIETELAPANTTDDPVLDESLSSEFIDLSFDGTKPMIAPDGALD